MSNFAAYTTELAFYGLLEKKDVLMDEMIKYLLIFSLVKAGWTQVAH